jgi:uncharacterized membrane protein YbhN (UPF0104 family)
MRILKLLVKIGVSAGLIAFMLHTFDVKGLADHLREASPWSLAAVVMISIAMAPLHAARWLVVVRAAGGRLALGPATKMVLIGYFFSQVLPSAVGGDAVRTWCAYRAGLRASDAVNSVVLDRAIALVGLMLLGAFTLPWLADRVGDATLVNAFAAVIVLGIGGFAAFVGFGGLTKALTRWRVGRLLSRLADLARATMLTPARVVPLLAISIGGFVVACWLVYMIARGMSLEIRFTDCLLLVPPVLLASVIPVSIAGWGMREGAMVVALGFAGVAPAAAFVVSVLYGLCVAAASLPGSLFWLAGDYSSGALAEVERFEESAGER